ncbi:MAG: M1 family metallopeptidase [Acidobacteriota bacterium]
MSQGLGEISPGTVFGLWLAAPLLLALAAGAATGASPSPLARDAHSFARPDDVRVKHLALDLTVDFAARTLAGNAQLTLENSTGARSLVLDTRDLDIRSVHLDGSPQPARFTLGQEVKFLGRSLTIEILPTTKVVRVDYSSRPEASAVQWLTPAQTAGGKQPFLFTQSEAILARTWVPCQDTPSVRMTYEAVIHVPAELMAVMSAENPTERTADGIYHFSMPQPIPSYLLALAVGDLEFRSMGPRSGVYAEPSMLAKSAYELADTETMITAAEALYGPYRWGRYDLLVLPPSFPFGGMENPRLTFATPTILAGDRSLVSLVAHELAHSWSGNLVTNATWNDVWLNEGFTNYFENRIMEAVSGRDFSEMLATLQYQSLTATVKEMGPTNPDTKLHLDLAGRDPDEGTGDIAYEKGFFFLRALEQAAGRDRIDAFLRGYFDHFAFHSMDTAHFVAYLQTTLLGPNPDIAKQIDPAAWIETPGLPASLKAPESKALAGVSAVIARWTHGTLAKSLDTKGWSTQHWLYFLNNLPAMLAPGQMSDLDGAFHFTTSGNSEILFAWLKLSLQNQYTAADPALDHFLTTVGRRKFIVPLYKELAKTPSGLERARALYARARPGYHPVAVTTLDTVLGKPGLSAPPPG